MLLVGVARNAQRTQNNKIKIRVFYMFISSFLVATASYAQSSQNNKFSILPMIVSNLKNKEIDQGSCENVLLFGLLKFVVFFTDIYIEKKFLFVVLRVTYIFKISYLFTGKIEVLELYVSVQYVMVKLASTDIDEDILVMLGIR